MFGRLQQTSQLFKGLTISFGKLFSTEEKNELSRLIKQNGGSVSAFIGPSTTHLILNNWEPRISNSFAGFPVYPTFITDSIDRKKLQDELKYVVLPITQNIHKQVTEVLKEAVSRIKQVQSGLTVLSSRPAVVQQTKPLGGGFDLLADSSSLFSQSLLSQPSLNVTTPLSSGFTSVGLSFDLTTHSLSALSLLDCFATSASSLLPSDATHSVQTRSEPPLQRSRFQQQMEERAEQRRKELEAKQAEKRRITEQREAQRLERLQKIEEERMKRVRLSEEKREAQRLERESRSALRQRTSAIDEQQEPSCGSVFAEYFEQLKREKREARERALEVQRQRKEELRQRKLQQALVNKQKRKEEVRLAREQNAETNKLRAEEQRLESQRKRAERQAAAASEREKAQEQARLERQKRIEERMQKLQKFLAERDRILTEERSERGKKVFVGKVLLNDITSSDQPIAIKEQAIEVRKKSLLDLLATFGPVVRVKEYWDQQHLFVVYATEIDAMNAIEGLKTFEARQERCESIKRELASQGITSLAAPLPKFYLRLPKNSSKQLMSDTEISRYAADFMGSVNNSARAASTAAAARGGRGGREGSMPRSRSPEPSAPAGRGGRGGRGAFSGGRGGRGGRGDSFASVLSTRGGISAARGRGAPSAATRGRGAPLAARGARGGMARSRSPERPTSAGRRPRSRSPERPLGVTSDRSASRGRGGRGSSSAPAREEMPARRGRGAPVAAVSRGRGAPVAAVSRGRGGARMSDVREGNRYSDLRK